MSRTSKSPRRVAWTALDVGRKVYADYSHPNSPKVYTQPQLFACLVMRLFWKTSYEGVVAQLEHPLLTGAPTIGA